MRATVPTTTTLTVPVTRCVYCHQTEASATTCTDGSQYHVFHAADERVTYEAQCDGTSAHAPGACDACDQAFADCEAA